MEKIFDEKIAQQLLLDLGVEPTVADGIVAGTLFLERERVKDMVQEDD